jgi:hypothetical protein
MLPGPEAEKTDVYESRLDIDGYTGRVRKNPADVRLPLRRLHAARKAIRPPTTAGRAECYDGEAFCHSRHTTSAW